MQTDTLNEREFELINIIGAKLGSNQRDLSQMMNLSLGMVNMLIRRLIAKGYIRINQLDKKKVEYILTPQGFTEKMRKSVKYTFKTIHSIGVIKNRLKEALVAVVEDGHRDFIIVGESDFAILVEMILKELCGSDYRVTHVHDFPQNGFEGFVLICKEDIGELHPVFKDRSIDLVEALAKEYTFELTNRRA